MRLKREKITANKTSLSLRQQSKKLSVANQKVSSFKALGCIEMTEEHHIICLCIFFPTDDSDGGGELFQGTLRVRGEERGHGQDALQGQKRGQ